MTNRLPSSALLAATALLVLAPLAARAAPVTFDTVAPRTLVVGQSATVDNGFVATITGDSDGAMAVVGTPATVQAAVAAGCSTDACTDSGSQALYVFQNASLTLSAPSGSVFDATSFAAALVSFWSAEARAELAASNFLVSNAAVRLRVDGTIAGVTQASNTFLLLPPDYVGEQPQDPASTDNTAFHAIDLSGHDGYTGIDALTVTLVGAIDGDPDALTTDTGFSLEFAVDDVGVANLRSTQPVPEPASAALLLAGLGLLTAARRGRTAL